MSCISGNSEVSPAKYVAPSPRPRTRAASPRTRPKGQRVASCTAGTAVIVAPPTFTSSPATTSTASRPGPAQQLAGATRDQHRRTRVDQRQRGEVQMVDVQV